MFAYFQFLTYTGYIFDSFICYVFAPLAAASDGTHPKRGASLRGDSAVTSESLFHLTLIEAVNVQFVAIRPVLAGGGKTWQC